MNKFAKVLLPLPFNKPFDYAVTEGKSYNTGDYVLVPFGRKQLWGVIWELTDKPDIDKSKIKTIVASAEESGLKIPAFSEKLKKLIEWQADYTVEEKGKVLGLCLNGKFFKEVKERKAKAESSKLTAKSEVKLSQEQNSVKTNILNRLGSFSVTLLEGLTGSGKTEVYFEAVEKILDDGRQVLIMLPEILLTTQLIKRFEKHFGFKPVLWHSIVSEAKRRKAFFNIANGAAKVVIGARSSLHLPYKNLGLIIVDEEHDASYKQEEQVIYNARDIAVVRGKLEDIPVILASATPSIESYHNVKTGKYFHEKLTQRFNDAELPEVELIDMRQDKLSSKEFISNNLRGRIRDNLEQGNQSLLFLNRRGYAPLTLCSKCGFRFKSPDTSAWMVMHMNSHGAPYLQCHHSGYTMNMPAKCPQCNAEDSFRACGPGVQRLAEEVRALFPYARVLEMASDTTASPKKMDELIEKIENKEADIIIGTQIIAKGHHFPGLSLVGIIDGDLGLDTADLRASEKTFQLLHQVSGRAGREKTKGRVYIQTFNAEHKVMQCLLKNDLQEFLEFELNERKNAGLPPFVKLCTITVIASSDSTAHKAAKELISKFERNSKVRIFGPAPAIYHEYRGNYRYRLLLKTDKSFNLQNYIRTNLDKFKTQGNIKIRVDIDPYNFS